MTADDATPAEAGLALDALLGTLGSSAQGLSTAEALRRWQAGEERQPHLRRRFAGAAQLARLFANPLVLILLAASLVSALLGEAASALLIAVIVLLSAGLNFVQTYRSQRAAEALRRTLVPTATVLRDGAWVELPRAQVVVGDLLRLTAGDLAPADARLVQARDLHVQQAALTGESLPVEKEAGVDAGAPSRPAARNMVCLGSSVVSGTATAVVVATGRDTVFGDIAARLADAPPETEFDRGTRRFSVFIMETVFGLVLLMFLVSAAGRRPPLESLLFAVSLAVGLTPEFLPMITTVTLARGAVRMARSHVIVKHLSAMQNFGSIDVLCSDKTGTLTSGVMVLEKCHDVQGRPAEEVFRLAYVNSSYETGIRSPLDAAILKHAPLDLAGYAKLDEIPFDFERRRLSVVVERGGERLLIVKGAPESVLPLCAEYADAGRRVPLDAAARERSVAQYRGLSADGYRVLAVAWRAVAPQPAYRAEDECELVLAGFAAFLDPPLPEAAEILAALREDGVTVKILTGDNELVTRHVCGRVGLAGGRLVLGDDVARMSDAALLHVADETDVFARLSPGQKNRIIHALQTRGHVVGYLGDGINDALSLHAADVGISVAGAVDVAREAADIILVEPGLRVLQTGIIEGRKAFGNVMKYLLMGTSSNFGNMLSMAVATLFLPFLPMLPPQILLNNFLYDLSQLAIPTDRVDAAFVRKPRRWDISLIRRFMLLIGPVSSLYDFLTFYALLQLFHASEALFHTGWFVESLTTQTLVLLVIRTAGNPFRSRPSLPLLGGVLLVVALGLALPFSPLAELLGFVRLPASYFAFLVLATGTYLLLVELVKDRLLGRFLA